MAKQMHLGRLEPLLAIFTLLCTVYFGDSFSFSGFQHTHRPPSSVSNGYSTRRFAEKIATDTTKMNVEFVAECDLPTKFGKFRLRGYRFGTKEPTVVFLGDVSGDDVIVRVHDQCFTSEVLGSKRCDCRQQLDSAFEQIAKEGRGVIIYLQQEGRGIGLSNKIAAYSLQDGGLDTVEANHKLGFLDELRSYEIVPQILKDLKINSVKLLTNNPFKISSLETLGVQVSERLPILVKPNNCNSIYMKTKALRMSHILPKQSYQTDEQTEPSSTKINKNEVYTNPKNGKSYKWQIGRESVVNAIEAIRKGEIVCVTDDASRENEGDLIMAASKATTESLAFIIKYSGGVICCAMSDERLKELELPPMVLNNQDPKQTAFTVSVDTFVNTTTGISASDRAATFRMLADSSTTSSQLMRPGHVFPLRAKQGGVLARDGHTEATLDLCRLANLPEAGILSEIVTEDCTGMARMPEIETFARDHGLVLTTIEDMICYRLEQGI